MNDCDRMAELAHEEWVRDQEREPIRAVLAQMEAFAGEGTCCCHSEVAEFAEKLRAALEGDA